LSARGEAQSVGKPGSNQSLKVALVAEAVCSRGSQFAAYSVLLLVWHAREEAGVVRTKRAQLFAWAVRLVHFAAIQSEI